MRQTIEERKRAREKETDNLIREETKREMEHRESKTGKDRRHRIELLRRDQTRRERETEGEGDRVMKSKRDQQRVRQKRRGKGRKRRRKETRSGETRYTV